MQVNALAEASGIDIVQLHGSEDNDYIRRIKKPVCTLRLHYWL